jgi:Tol biopolymer transport system component
MSVRADGRDLRPLTEGYSYDGTWSPDGRELLVNLVANADDFSFIRVNADGTGAKRLPVAAGGNPTSWSADGGKILFSAGESEFSQHLYVMNPDGTGVRRLVQDGAILWALWNPNAHPGRDSAADTAGAPGAPDR